jgi:hypothetical protein
MMEAIARVGMEGGFYSTSLSVWYSENAKRITIALGRNEEKR